MGFVYDDDSIAKGPVTYCLDELSVRPDADVLLSQLQVALAHWTPGIGYALEDLFERFLFNIIYAADTKNRIQKAKDYLKAKWFPAAGGGDFGEIRLLYVTGLLQTLKLSLLDEHGNARKTPLPIDSYWIVQPPVAGKSKVELINLLSENQVTLLISTPRPPTFIGIIFSETPKAWTTAEPIPGMPPVTRQIQGKAP